MKCRKIYLKYIFSSLLPSASGNPAALVTAFRIIANTFLSEHGGANLITGERFVQRSSRSEIGSKRDPFVLSLITPDPYTQLVDKIQTTSFQREIWKILSVDKGVATKCRGKVNYFGLNCN